MTQAARAPRWGLHLAAALLVAVAHAGRLAGALRELGRAPRARELHLYEGGGHRPRTLSGSGERAEAFLQRVADLHPAITRLQTP